MTIAIDLDNTWTADVTGWAEWYQAFRSRGHTIIMATLRSKWTDDMSRFQLPSDMPIVYCWGSMKQEACKRAGFRVDVWIDDTPGTIQDCRILMETGHQDL